jgi:hypothetical protein
MNQPQAIGKKPPMASNIMTGFRVGVGIPKDRWNDQTIHAIHPYPTTRKVPKANANMMETITIQRGVWGNVSV